MIVLVAIVERDGDGGLSVTLLSSFTDEIDERRDVTPLGEPAQMVVERRRRG